MARRSRWILVALCLGGCVLPEYEASPEVDAWLTGTGGNATGGVPASGGQIQPGTGGAATGGTATGGAATGGRETGGARTGGTATGGAETGGAETGGVTTGGAPPATGGTSSVGGTLSGIYLDDGTVHGYCFGAHVIGTAQDPWELVDELCHDYVMLNEVWDEVVFLGCNLNQPIEGGEGTEGLWTPPGPGGICVYGSGFERIQIQGPDAADDPNDRWCAAVPRGVGGCVDWQEFNTMCWDGTGIDYTNEPLQGVLALQPSLGSVADGVFTDPLEDTICVTEISVY